MPGLNLAARSLAVGLGLQGLLSLYLVSAASTSSENRKEVVLNVDQNSSFYFSPGNLQAEEKADKAQGEGVRKKKEKERMESKPRKKRARIGGT